jgi:hypothetical protein
MLDCLRYCMNVVKHLPDVSLIGSVEFRCARCPARLLLLVEMRGVGDDERLHALVPLHRQVPRGPFVMSGLGHGTLEDGVVTYQRKRWKFWDLYGHESTVTLVCEGCGAKPALSTSCLMKLALGKIRTGQTLVLIDSSGFTLDEYGRREMPPKRAQRPVLRVRRSG